MAVKIEEDTKSKEFSDEYDIVKNITDIHSGETGITTDMVLFNSKEEETRKFIIEQYKIARRFRELIKDKEVAEQVYKNLMSEINIIAVLNRNDDKNFIVSQLLKRGQEPTAEKQQDEERKGILDRLLRREKEKDTEE